MCVCACVCVFDGFYRQYRRDMRGNSRAVSKLRVAAETCKRVLSTVGAAQCSVDSLYEGIDFNSTLSRSDGRVLITDRRCRSNDTLSLQRVSVGMILKQIRNKVS